MYFLMCFWFVLFHYIITNTTFYYIFILYWMKVKLKPNNACFYKLVYLKQVLLFLVGTRLWIQLRQINTSCVNKVKYTQFGYVYYRYVPGESEATEQKQCQTSSIIAGEEDGSREQKKKRKVGQKDCSAARRRQMDYFFTLPRKKSKDSDKWITVN